MVYRRVAVVVAIIIRRVRLIISSLWGPYAWRAFILVY